MNLLRSIALLVLGGTALAANATPIPAGSVGTTPSSGFANSPSLYAITRSVGSSGAGNLAPVASANAVFASAPVPVGDAMWSLRPYAITGETMAAAVVEAVPPASPTPEPAGLLLLGTGAFATALSIRYRLFSL